MNALRPMINRNVARAAATRTQFAVRSKATTAREIIAKNNEFKVRPKTADKWNLLLFLLLT